MLIGIMSDIHASIYGLERSVKKLESLGIDDLYICGDIVGYGKKPNECCDFIRSHKYKTVIGNHDWSLLGRNGFDKGHKSIFQHRQILSDKNVNWLDNLPLTIKENKMYFSHAELVSPEKFSYMHSCVYSYRNDQFDVMDGDICFIGHSHFKEMFIEETLGGRVNHKKIDIHDMIQYLNNKHRYIISVGSVGVCCKKTKRRNVVTYDTNNRVLKYIEV